MQKLLTITTIILFSTLLGYGQTTWETQLESDSIWIATQRQGMIDSFLINGLNLRETLHENQAEYSDKIFYKTLYKAITTFEEKGADLLNDLDELEIRRKRAIDKLKRDKNIIQKSLQWKSPIKSWTSVFNKKKKRYFKKRWKLINHETDYYQNLVGQMFVLNNDRNKIPTGITRRLREFGDKGIFSSERYNISKINEYKYNYIFRDIQMFDESLSQIKGQHKEKQSLLESKRSELEESDKKLKETKRNLALVQSESKVLQEKFKSQSRSLNIRKLALDRSWLELDLLAADLKEKDQFFQYKKRELEEKDKRLEEQENELDEYRGKFERDSITLLRSNQILKQSKDSLQIGQANLAAEKKAYYENLKQWLPRFEWTKDVVTYYGGILGLILAVISLIWGIYTFFFYKRVQGLTKEVDNQNKTLALLMRELNHRVKNNLQFTSSMLSLQAKKADEKSVHTALNAAKDRVYAMSVLYEGLYQQKDYEAKIDLKWYIHKLASHLLDAYGYPRRFLQTAFGNYENILINADKADAIGVIINELAHNCIKHGFVDNPDPRLNIVVSMDHEYLNITIKDNGKGIGEDFDINKKSSFGLYMVRMLIEDLRGELKFTNNNGACYDVKMKKQYLMN